MKKCYKLLTGACLLMLSLSTYAQTIIRGPYLQSGAPGSMVIKWRTDNATSSRVWYGASPSNLAFTNSISGNRTDHEVRISGLAANTAYYYAVGNASGQLTTPGSSYYFRTSPAPGSVQTVRAWVLGDAGKANANQRAVRDAFYNFIGDTHIDAILLLGDNAYEEGTDAQYQAAMFENMYEGRLINSVVWPSFGNHDGLSATSVTQTGPYYEIFTTPVNGEAGGVPSGTEAYYSFDYGNVHFIALDSDDSGREPGSPQLVWLENDLSSTTQEWKVVFFHHPPYTQDASDTNDKETDMRANVLPVLEAYGVDLVLAGHDHIYERSYLINGHYGRSNTWDPATMGLDLGDGRLDGNGAYMKSAGTTAPGTVYIVAGSAGSRGTITAEHPAMFETLREKGSLYLEFTGSQLDGKFVREDGVIDDYFTIIKQTINGALPTVSITAPVHGANYTTPLAINITADASDSDGAITQVEFFVNGASIGIDVQPPYAAAYNLPGEGTYEILAIATDDDGNTANSSATQVTVGPGSACVRISAGSDDAEERPTGSVTLTSSDLELVSEPGQGDQAIGLRFNGLNIPQGASIMGAYIQFCADEAANDNPSALTIYGEDTDHAATFTTGNSNISSRPRTSASVAWSPADWQAVGDAGIAQQTPDLSNILQEIVSRPGYTASSSVAFIITGAGRRVAESYEGSATSAPQLCVQYALLPTYDCPGLSADIGNACDDGDNTTVNDAVDDNCNCAGTPTACTGIGDMDGDGICSDLDCDDNNPDLGSNADDMDCDGLPGNIDCDDNDASIAYQPGDACDDGNPATYGETIQADCSCGGGATEPASACAAIQGTSDDVEQYPDGNMDINSSDLELVNEPRRGAQIVGLRFSGLNIPQGAQIVGAYIQFTVDESNNDDPCSLTIYGEASDNAALFSNTSFELSNRPRTGASVSWSPASWLAVGAAGDAQRTVDISPVIQEIVNRSGYTPSSSVAILIEGAGRRVAESVDGDPAGAPQLCIDYFDTPANYDCPALSAYIGNSCDDGDNTTVNDMVDAGCNCAGTPTACTGIGDMDGDGICADVDCDDNNAAVTTVDADQDGVCGDIDCDDNDAAVTTTHIGDADCDGVPAGLDCDDSDPSVTSTNTGDGDCDGVPTGEDCDDSDPTVTTSNIGDADCDGVPTADDCDDNDPSVGLNDNDADCDGVPTAEDCNDNDPTRGSNVHDMDCDGIPADIDCDDSNPAVTSTNIGDADCDGVPAGEDCDDSDPAVTSSNAGDADCDGVPTGEDCDDSDPAVTSSNIGDADCDGVPTAEDCDDGNPALGSNAGDMDCDGVPAGQDCDDSDPGVATQPGDACDDGNPATYGETIQADCSCGGGTTEPASACAAINSSTDDAEEHPNGNMDLNSSDLELVNEPTRGLQVVGLRFNGLNIPQGAQIVGAYVQFTVDETRDENPCNLIIYGEDSDNAAAFANTAFNISSRPRTTASAAWSPGSWSGVGNAGAAQKTVDISSVIQEIVNRSGYTSASSIVILMEGGGRRTAESFDGASAMAPQLCIDFFDTPPNYDCPGQSAFFGDACDDGDNTTANDAISANCDCVGQPTACTGIGDADGDGVCTGLDCDDTDASITTADADGDGVCGDIDCDDNDAAVTTTNTGDGDCDGVPAGLDCDDSDPAVVSTNTGDGDCDGVPTGLDCNDSDPAITSTNAGDADCDGVPAAEDCDDNNPDIGNAAEDADCDGLPVAVDCDDSDPGVAYQPGDPCNDGDNTTFGETIQADCSCGGGNSAPIFACSRVSASEDDVEERTDGGVSRTSSDLELVDDPGQGLQAVGLRFNGLDIPPGAAIANAYIQFAADETRNDNPCNLIISGQASDNAPAFANADFEVSSRARTTAAISWSPPEWLTIGQAGPAQQTPDISAIIQEIVNRSGYTSASSIVLIIEGTGRRTAESFNGAPAAAPELCVEYFYSPPGLRPAPPVANTAMSNTVSVVDAGNGGQPAAPGQISPIALHPNPASNKLTVAFSSSAEGQMRVQARNLNGQIVLHEIREIRQGHNAITLEGLSLPDGIYFLQAFIEDTVQSAKFVIQKD